jgi:urocanate hydratase
MPSGGLDFPEIDVVYGRFAALTALSTDVGGWLLLYSGMDCEGVAVAIATNVAGAASLGIEPDAERAKQALRAGVCDFLVNNLDEALRILKNEIRKKRAVSVVLTCEVSAAVAEMIARGVQPEILAFDVPELVGRGAKLLSARTDDGTVALAWSGERAALTVIDDLAAESIGSKTDPRLRWIAFSPRYLGRVYAGQRHLRMSSAEADAFVELIRAAVRSGAIPAAVRVRRDGEDVPLTN